MINLYELEKGIFITVDDLSDSIIIINYKKNTITFVINENGKIKEIEYFVPDLKKRLNLNLNDRKNWIAKGYYLSLTDDTKRILRRLKSIVDLIDDTYLRVKIKKVLENVQL
jgi:CRISPR/Cas system CMR-associated protein Cmr5 small subunit